MKKSRKIWMASLLIVVLILSACSKKDTAATDADGKKTLLLWHYYSGEFEKRLNGYIDEYNKSQDKVKIETQYIPYNQMQQQVSTATAGGDLPEIILADTVWNSAFAGSGQLEDLTDKIKEWGEAVNFYEGPLKSTTLDGKNFGIPYTSNLAVLYYNKAMLKDAGLAEPPKTWDELKTVAKKMTTKDHGGFAMSAAKSENGTFAFLSFLLSTGVNFDKLDSPEAVKTMDFLKGLIDDQSMNKSVLNLPQDDITKMFANNQLGMMVNGSWDIGTVQTLAPDLDFGVSFVPKDKEYAASTGGENWMIVKGDHVDTAWDFVKWMEEPGRMTEMNVAAGNIPPRKDVKLELDDKPHLKQAVEVMPYATPRGPSPKWPEISEAIQLAYQKSFTNSASSKDALKEASDKIKTITGE